MCLLRVFIFLLLFHCIDIAMFVYPLSVDGHLNDVEFLAIMSEAVKNILLQIFLWTCVFILLGEILKSRIVGSKSRYMLII